MPYRFDKPLCPRCSEPVEGTVESVSGLAELDQVGDGLFDYGGYTRIDWDGQRTVSRDGEVLLECGQGHRWWSRRDEVPTPTPKKPFRTGASP